MQPPPGPYGQPPGAYGRQSAPNGACCPASSEARRVREGAAAPSSVIREPARGRDVLRRVRFPRPLDRTSEGTRVSLAPRSRDIAASAVASARVDAYVNGPRDLTPPPPTPLATLSTFSGPRTPSAKQAFQAQAVLLRVDLRGR